MSQPPAARRRSATADVPFSRIEGMLREECPAWLQQWVSEAELAAAGTGDSRIARLASALAAKEAACALFSQEALSPADFQLQELPANTAAIEPSARASLALDRRRIATLRTTLAITGDSATATVLAEPRVTRPPWYGRLFYHLLPWRRSVVMANLERVFGDYLSPDELRCLAQDYYGHLLHMPLDFFRLRLMTAARRERLVRVENMEIPIRAHTQGKGILLLTGHFGNWEVATVAGIGKFPQYRDLFHFVRKPLRPQWLNDFITRRFQKSGLGTLARRGSLDTLLELLSGGAIIGFIMDQHCSRKEGVRVEFLGHPATTYKSLAIVALSTGAPVLPACCWREPNGTHVLRFEEPVPLIECEDTGEAIRQNTRAYNTALERMLLRHPEQWIWMHKRWKNR